MPSLYKDSNSLLALMSQEPLSMDAISHNSLKTLDKFIHEKQAAINAGPTGSLLLHTPKNPAPSTEFYQYSDKNKHYLNTKDDALKQALAQKDYNRAQLKEAQRLRKALEKVAKVDLQFHETYGDLRKERQELVTPDFLPEEMVRELWSTITYDTISISANARFYYTSKEEKVRSIAEQKIGNRLHSRDVLYLYEYPFHLADGGIVYPDFTCLNMRTRQLYIWEHMGMLDDTKYAANNFRKLERYRNTGFYVGINIIVTYETNTHMLTDEDIDTYIDHYLL